MIRLVVILLFLCLLLSGCSYHSAMSNHILSADNFGRFVNPTSGKIKTDPKDYFPHLSSLLDNKGRSILIYIHGGLNIESSANKRVDRLAGLMSEDGYHPIFINWRSGFFSTYREHLFHDRQGDYWCGWGYPSSPIIFAEDIGRGVIRAPMVWWHQTNSFLKSIDFGGFPGDKSAIKINQRLVVEQTSAGKIPFGAVPGVVDSNGESIDDRRGGLRQFWNGFEGVGKLILGLSTAPIFDSLGTSSWDTMKRRTDTLVDLTIPDCHGDGETDRKGPVHQFFDELRKKQAADPNLKIVLVGHSMGSIVASKILREWRDINYDKIIFMAAACTIEDYRSSVRPHLEKVGSATKFYNYMLHPIAENQEAHGFGIGGTGTLLNQIDNFYENSVSESKRTLGKWVNVMNGIDYFDVPGTKGRIYLRTIPYDYCYPTTHGSFDDVIYCNEDIRKFWKDFVKERGTSAIY